MNKENDNSVGENNDIKSNDLDWMEYFYETITLPSEAYEKFISLVNNPPKPSEKLYNLFIEGKK